MILAGQSEDQDISPASSPRNNVASTIIDPNVPCDRGIEARDHVRDLGFEFNDSMLRKEPQRTETRREEEDDNSQAIIGRISDRLHREKLPSTHFEREIPPSCSLEYIELFIFDLI